MELNDEYYYLLATNQKLRAKCQRQQKN